VAANVADVIHGYLQMIGMVDAAEVAMELRGAAIRDAFERVWTSR
jgi:hypothetical protein